MTNTTTKKSIPESSMRNGKAEAIGPAPAINVEIAMVTPDMAANWLAKGGKNRKLNERRVDALVAAMHRGEWQLTGDSIKLDDDGRIRDGQHRLKAIVKSGVSIQTLVIRGVSEEAFDVMDSGRSRTVGDVVGMHGYVSRNGVAGAVRLLIFMERYQRFAPNVREANQIITAPVTLAYLAKHDDVVSGIRMGDTIRQAGLMGGISVWGALMTLFLRIDAESAYQFQHFLTTGADMSKGHPALLLRNRLLWRREGKTQASLIGREQTAALVIKAWNAFRKGQQIQQLLWRADGPKPEAFPVPA